MAFEEKPGVLLILVLLYIMCVPPPLHGFLQYFLFVLDFLQFESNIPRCRFYSIYPAWYSLAFWICEWCWPLILEYSQLIITSNISSTPFSFFPFWYSYYAYIIVFVIVLQFLDILFHFFQSFFLFDFQFGILLFAYLHTQWFFFSLSHVQSTKAHKKHSLFLLQCFWFLEFFFIFFEFFFLSLCLHSTSVLTCYTFFPLKA